MEFLVAIFGLLFVLLQLVYIARIALYTKETRDQAIEANKLLAQTAAALDHLARR